MNNNNNNNKDRIYFLFFPFFDVYSREGKKTFLQTTQEPVVHTIVSSTHIRTVYIYKKPFLFFFILAVIFGPCGRVPEGGPAFLRIVVPPRTFPASLMPFDDPFLFFFFFFLFYSLVVIFFSFLFSPVRKANTHNAQQPKTTYSATTTTTTIISNI